MYREAFELIQRSKKVVILSHIYPDEDAIGSSLALYSLLKLNKVVDRVYITNSTVDIDFRFKSLPNFHKIKSTFPKNIDLVITLDSGSLDRVGFKEELEGVKILNIDHHITNQNYGDINLIEPELASTSTLIYKFAKLNSLKIDRDVSSAIYVGLVGDTGFFKYESTNSFVFEVAKELVELGAKPNEIANILTKEPLSKFRLSQRVLNTLKLSLDGKFARVYLTQKMLAESGADINQSEGLVERVRDLATVEVATLYKELEYGKFKVSLRSKTKVDVSKVAFSFGGGGHIRASGFDSKLLDIEQIDKILIDKFREVICL